MSEMPATTLSPSSPENSMVRFFKNAGLGVGDAVKGALMFPDCAVGYILGRDNSLGEQQAWSGTWSRFAESWKDIDTSPINRTMVVANTFFYGGADLLSCHLLYVIDRAEWPLNVYDNPFFTPPPSDVRGYARDITSLFLLFAGARVLKSFKGSAEDPLTTSPRRSVKAKTREQVQAETAQPSEPAPASTSKASPKTPVDAVKVPPPVQPSTLAQKLNAVFKSRVREKTRQSAASAVNAGDVVDAGYKPLTNSPNATIDLGGERLPVKFVEAASSSREPVYYTDVPFDTPEAALAASKYITWHWMERAPTLKNAQFRPNLREAAPYTVDALRREVFETLA